MHQSKQALELGGNVRKGVETEQPASRLRMPWMRRSARA